MKNNIVLIIITLLLLTGCNIINNDMEDGKLVGTSNDISNKLQIKIITEYINIRKEQSVESEILGIVKKNSIFDVIDYKKINDYLWVHIKTNNNIDGYVASFEDEKYYEFTNGDIDYTAPTLTINVDKIIVDSFYDLTDEYIKSIVKYEDDKDKNPNFTYEIKDDGYNYYIIFKVKDSSNNEAEKTIDLEIKNEKQASNKEWITYDKVRELRTTFINIAKKYGEASTFVTLTNDYWRIDFGNTTTIMVFTDYSWLYGCTFNAIDDDIKVLNCNDEVGEISYENIKTRLTYQEESAKNAYYKIKQQFEQTGYKISDLFLDFDN